MTAAELQAIVTVDEAPMQRGLSGMLSSINSWGGKAGKAFAVLGAAGGGLFAAGVASGMSAQDLAAGLQAELGVSAEKAGEYGELAGRLYAQNYGASLDDVGTAVSSVVSSIDGMREASSAAVEDMTAKALTVADVFEIDVARAAQIAGQAVSQGLASDAGQAMDLMTASMQQMPAAIREDLLDAVDEYGGILAGMGITGEAAFGLLVQGAEKGAFGVDKTGDALKELSIRATDMSAGTVAAYEAMGLSAEDMTAQMLAGGDQGAAAFDQIVDGLRGIQTPADQAAAAIALFGTPVEDLGVTDIPAFLETLDQGADALGDFEGATDRAGDALANTASGNLASFWRSLQAGTIGVLGGAVIPAVTQLATLLNQNLGPALALAGEVARAAGDYLQAFGGWVGDNEKPIRIVAGVIGAVYLPLLIAMGVQSLVSGARVAAGWALGAVAAVASSAVQSVAIAVAVAGWILMGAQAMLGAARIAAAWFIALGPIGWVIAAVIGLVALIALNFEAIKGWIGGAWDWVSAKTAAAWALITSGVAGGITSAVGFVASLPGRAVGALASLGSMIGGVVRGAMTGAYNLVVNKGGEIIGWLVGLPGRIVAAVGSRFGDAGRSLLQGFIDGMKNAAGIIEGIAGNVWDAIKGLLNGAIGKLNDALNFDIGIPGPDIRVRLGNIPMLATGGRATGGMLAVIGEGKEPETVLPDSVLRGLLERTHAAGQRQSAQRDGRAVEAHFHGTHEASARELVNELAHAVQVGRYGGVYGGLAG